LSPSRLGRPYSRLFTVADALMLIKAEAFLVGGAVRDALRGAAPRRDLDIAVTGDGLDIAERLARRFADRATLVPLDAKRGCARVVFKDDQPTTIDICSLKGTGIDSDLAARDFTINAIAVKLEDLARERAPLIDPLGGGEDIRQGIIRACAPTSFSDDPLRLLRAFRFRATMGFEIALETRRMMASAAAGLKRVSPERIRDELAVVFAHPHSADVLEEMDRCRILDLIFPELSQLKGVEQNLHHHLDVFQHTLETVRRLEGLLRDKGPLRDEVLDKMVRWAAVRLVAGRPRIWLLKLAALLHDTGKPACKFTDEEGRVRFFGHEKASAQLAAAACTRLKLSSREARLVVTLVESHMRPMALTGPVVSRRVLFRLSRDLGDDLPGLALLFLADLEASRGPARSAESVHAAHRGIMQAMEFSDGKRLTGGEPLLRGDDVMKFCGIKPGPIVGALLAIAEEARATGEARTKEEALALVKAKLEEGIVAEGKGSDRPKRSISETR
jgi:tRNA nucleotidyltransferase/poly(A) polymerase